MSRDDVEWVMIHRETAGARKSKLIDMPRKNKLISGLSIALGLWMMFNIMESSPLLKDRTLYQKSYYSSDFFKGNPAAKGSDPFDVERTIERLYTHFPQVDIQKGSDHIFQVWKKAPEECKDGEFPNSEWHDQWILKNPTANYTFYKLAHLEQLFRDTFIDTVPEVYEAYQLLPQLILQSDFGRYLLIFLEGGTFADNDVLPHVPINTWYDHHISDDIKVVIALKDDVNTEYWANRTPRRIEFVQWVFKSTRRHPSFARMIAHIVKTTFEAQAEHHVQKSQTNEEYEEDTIIDPFKAINPVDWAGSGVFTDSIFEYFNSKKDLEIVDLDISRSNMGQHLYGPERVLGERIDWRFFTGMNSPIVIDDTLILPVKGFSSKEPCADFCYAAHRYHGR